jgi:hypothetical protein
VEARGDITLVELGAAMAEHGNGAAVSTLWRFFDRHQIKLKKTGHAAEQDRPTDRTKRQAWFRRPARP